MRLNLFISIAAISLFIFGACSNDSGSSTGGEICANQIDDDSDGFIDCDDSDCADSCEFLEICDNDIDDDNDGFADCDDQDCIGNELCTSVPLEVCDNNVDDDFDGFIDCDDIDCLDICEYIELCDNNIDDDSDGFTDCDDQDCVSNQACSEPIDEICGNNIDDDWDGLVDCADEDCDDAQVCIVLIDEICDNNIDDDNDGFTDCDDIECLDSCEYLENCNNNIDDDNDGFIDCDDQDCVNSELCIPDEICSNTDDDDLDGMVSCLDDDCFGESACGECNPFDSGNSGCGSSEYCYIDINDGYIPRCFSDRGNADEGENCNVANDCRPGFLCIMDECFEPCYPDVEDDCDCVPFTDLNNMDATTQFGFCD
jgi:hypothetical protein